MYLLDDPVYLDPRDREPIINEVYYNPKANKGDVARRVTGLLANGRVYVTYELRTGPQWQTVLRTGSMPFSQWQEYVKGAHLIGRILPED